MLNNIKSVNIKILFLMLPLCVLVNSCKKEKQYKCTTYLKGAVWSEQIVSDCSLCTAPQGYTTSCR
jgi:hypothetical protein